MAQVIYIKNPFDPIGSREIVKVTPFTTVQRAIEDVLGEPVEGLDLSVGLNGIVIKEYDKIICPSDSITFCLVPHGGGGGGGSKNIVRTVALIAVMVAAPQLASMWGGGWAATEAGTLTFAGSMFAASIALAGTMLVNAVIPVQSNLGTEGAGVTDWSDSSPTYGWEVQKNRISEGGALPVLYGKMRVVPPCIMKYVTTEGNNQYLNLLYAVAGHEVDSITGITINQQSSEYYEDVTIKTRLGTSDQELIPEVDAIRSDVPIGATLNYGTPIERTTEGNTITGLGVGIILPRGLYYASSGGGLDTAEVNLKIGYRKIGESTYKYIGGTGEESTAVTKDVPAGQRYVDYDTAVVGSDSVSVQLVCPNQFESASGTTQLVYLMYNVYVKDDSGNWVKQITAQRVDVGNFVEVELEVTEGSIAQIRVERDSQGYYTSTPPIGTNSGAFQSLPDPTITYQGWDEVITISDSTQSVLRKFYSIEGIESAQYEVSVELTEEPPSGARYANTVQVDYIEEAVSGDGMIYPGVALLFVKALATSQLSGSYPQVSCIATRSLCTDGNSAYNPAWICKDMLTNADYGAGEDSDAIIDSKFESWADNCTAKNYLCSIYFDGVTNIRTAANQAAQIGWGNVLQAGSKYTAISEQEEELGVQRFLFTVGNILYKSYKEEWLSHTNRANSVEITYYDSQLDYTAQTIEVMQPDFDTTEVETRKTTVNLVGCTSRSQAAKYGKRLMNNNRYLTLTASWEADVDALGCTVGDVVDVQHDIPQFGFGGRLVQCIDSTHVQLDREVVMAAGKRYHFTVKLSDDSRQTIEVYNPGTEVYSDTLTLLTALNPLPVQYDLYSFGEIDQSTKAFRIVSITKSSDYLRKITAIEYVPEVYNDSITIPVVSQSALVAAKDLVLKEMWEPSSDGSAKSSINCSWRGSALYWDVYFKEAGATAWTKSARVYSPNHTIQGVSYKKTYTVLVDGGAGITDSPTSSITILGSDNVPDDVQNFQAFQSGDKVAFRWDHTPNIDRRGYQIRRGDKWQTGQIVCDLVQENASEWNAPMDGTFRFMIKALNNQLQYSETEAVSIATVDITTNKNFAFERDEIPTHLVDGTLFNLIYIAGSPDVLRWLPGCTDTDLAGMTDQSSPLDVYTGNTLAGTYETEVLDIGKVANILGVRMSAEYEADLIEDWVTDMSLATRTDLTYPMDTDTNITSESTYRPYYKFGETLLGMGSYALWAGVSQFSARYLQFKWETQIDIPAVTFDFISLPLSVEVNPVIKNLYNQSISAGGTTFELSAVDFDVVLGYNVGVTILSSSALYATVTQTTTNFTIKVWNSSGVSVAANVNIALNGA